MDDTAHKIKFKDKFKEFVQQNITRVTFPGIYFFTIYNNRFILHIFHNHEYTCCPLLTTIISNGHFVTNSRIKTVHKVYIDPNHIWV